jgi:hypothetical protein
MSWPVKNAPDVSEAAEYKGYRIFETVVKFLSGHQFTTREELLLYIYLGLRNQCQPYGYVNCLPRTNEIEFSSSIPN